VYGQVLAVAAESVQQHLYNSSLVTITDCTAVFTLHCSTQASVRAAVLADLSSKHDSYRHQHIGTVMVVSFADNSNTSVTWYSHCCREAVRSCNSVGNYYAWPLLDLWLSSVLPCQASLYTAARVLHRSTPIQPNNESLMKTSSEQ
jgi:hypothetical protein